jgi:hypothetical protein
VGVSLLGYTGILLAAVAANVLGAWGGAVAAHLNGLLRGRSRAVTVPARRLHAVTGSPDG